MGYTSLILRSIPIGGIISSAYSFGSYDENFIECYGYEFSKILYKHLYSVIGIQFGETNGSGGTGTSHFRVPDCRGRFLCHTPNITTFPIGSIAEDILGNHMHFVTAPANDMVEVNNLRPRQSDWSVGVEAARPTTFTSGTETRPKNVYVKYYIRYI